MKFINKIFLSISRLLQFSYHYYLCLICVGGNFGFDINTKSNGLMNYAFNHDSNFMEFLFRSFCYYDFFFFSNSTISQYNIFNEINRVLLCGMALRKICLLIYGNQNTGCSTCYYMHTLCRSYMKNLIKSKRKIEILDL